MNEQAILHARTRDETGKGAAGRLRAAGRVPAVMYGRDVESVKLSIDATEALRLFQAISVENTIVELNIDGEKEGIRTLVREIQAHVFKPVLHHVDFLRIQKGVKLEMDVPVHLVGTAEGVRNQGGILEQVIHSLHVRCIPSKIPASIDADVSALELGDSLHVYDLEVEDEVEILTDRDRTLCAVVAPKVIEEPVEDEDLEEIEGELGAEEVGEEASEESSEEEG